MVSALRESYKTGQLHRITNPQQVEQRLNEVMKKDWVIYSKPCLNHTDRIVAYLARYRHRIAISDQRLIGIDKDQVEFAYKDYRHKQNGTLKLDYKEFIRRFLMHILPKGLMRIRHYGLLSNRCRKTSITLIRKILAKPEEKKPQQAQEKPAIQRCPKCNKGYLVFIKKLEPEWTYTHTHPEPG